MIARLLISSSFEIRQKEINKILDKAKLTNPHPDLLYFPSDSKLGIIDARIIKEHFSLKPYSAKGRAAVFEDASKLTPEAQNALLKTFEELPEEGIIILGASSDAKFLPTVLSRCQITKLQGTSDRGEIKDYSMDVDKLLTSSIEDRFEYIEKLKERKEFLNSLIQYFHQDLRLHPGGGHLDFLKELLQAEEWAEANVNLRGILEYLMLKMPDD